METHPTETKGTALFSGRNRHKRIIALMGAFTGILAIRTLRFLPDYEGPWPWKLALVLAPWLVAGLTYLYGHRYYREDELETLINRRALAFAFCGAFFGLLILGQLQAAGFVPVIVWTAERLLTALCGLFLVGTLLSMMRYH